MQLMQDNLHELFNVVDTGQRYQFGHNKHQGFSFVNNNSCVLVVTVGDSWTWGLDIAPNASNQFRMSNVYGAIVARELNADWLNLGQSGSGNFWLANRVQEFGAIVSKLDYHKIYLFCTCTELGRALHAETTFDFVEFFRHHSPKELAHVLDLEITNRIVNATQDPRIVLKIGRNFVDHPGHNSMVLSTPWYQLLDPACDRPCFVVSPWAVDDIRSLLDAELVPTHYHGEFLSYCVDLLDLAIARKECLEKMPLINNLHPLPEAHRRWADYLLQQL